MSPIGRTFIVLNLIAAGAFVGFASTFIQRQHNWKTEHTKIETAFNEAKLQWGTERDRLDQDLREASSSASSFEKLLDAAKNDLGSSQDEVKRLREQNADLQAGVAALRSTTSAINSTVEQALAQAQDAYKRSNDAMAEKDAAIREKDATVAENRSLNNQIADLNATIENKDLQLAALNKDNGELNLLVDAARVKGFIDRMAVPVLDGTVSMVTGNLVTIAINNNPSEAEIKPGYRFAIYDAASATYKGEVRVTSVDSASNAAFCTVDIKKGELVAGDKASTHTAGVAGGM